MQRYGEVPGGPLDGPWQRAFWCHLPSPAKSKSNFRRYSDAASSSGNDWGSHTAFKQVVKVAVKQHVPVGWELAKDKRRLADRPAVVYVIAARTMLDSANLPKSILDACEGTVYVNDKSAVAGWPFAKTTKLEQGCEIAFAQLAPSPSLDEIIAASQQLTDAWREVTLLDV